MVETTEQKDTFRLRLDEVQRRIAASALRAGRAPEDVTLIAVSKTHPVPVIRRAIEAGAINLGENKVQEAEAKIQEIERDSRVRWHLIGHLQSNKARRAVKLFDCIHSLDSVELAERLERICDEEGRDELPLLVQIDLAGEATKTGADEAELPRIVDALELCRHLRLVGLMTLPPFFEDAEQVRPFFRRLRELRDKLRSQGVFKSGSGELSMGMSHDYEVAIEEGATMVRVGTAIFGERAAVAA